MNPDLPNPAAGDATGLKVSAPVALTRPMGTTFVDEHKCYICTVPNASTHREDGKKLAFVFGFLRTNIKQDIDYMQRQIEEGSQYFRLATPAEIESYDMRTDPRGTLVKSIKAELEPQMRQELEASIRQELEDKIRKEMLVGGSDVVKLGGVDSAKSRAAEVLKTATATIAVQSSGIKPVSTADVAAGAAQSGK